MAPNTILWAMSCRQIFRRLGEVYSPGAGHPPLPIRLMAGLLIVKHMQSLSDEAVCARFLDSPYVQFFCGEQVFRHDLPFDRSSLTRWRQRLGEERLAALLQESLSIAHKARPGILSAWCSTPRSSRRQSPIRPMHG